MELRTGGIKGEIFLAELTGTVNNQPVYYSSDNVLNIRLVTDSSVIQSGVFRIIWTTDVAEVFNDVQILTATSSVQHFKSPLYDSEYLPAEKVFEWKITASTENIITMQFENLDIGTDGKLYLWDQDAISLTPTLDVVNAFTSKYHISISKSIRLMLISGKGDAQFPKGIYINYWEGCNINYMTKEGTIHSPGYFAHSYPENIQCTWIIQRPTEETRAMTLRFNKFDIQPEGDYLKIYNDTTEALHAGDGFTGTADLTNNFEVRSTNGNIKLVFTTNYVLTDKGFEAEFSLDCHNFAVSPETHFNSKSKYEATFGNIVDFSCDEGYLFMNEGHSDSISISCQKGGEWTTPRIPYCIATYCPIPPAVNNAYIVESSGVKVDNNVTYKCNDGFTMNGETVIKCLNGGRWEESPRCNAAFCSALPAPENGGIEVLTGNGRDFASVLQYVCDPGYETYGNVTTYCQTGGKWSHVPPSCERIRNNCKNSTNITTADYTDENCNEKINECLRLYPCEHGGTCKDKVSDFECSCREGWTGKRCETPKEYCAPSPCLNGGVCFNLTDGFFCRCPSGTIGVTCGQSPNLCSVINPCTIKGTCEDETGTLQCNCNDDYAGTSCQFIKDHCSDPNTCQNDGKCVTKPLGFECECGDSYSGSTCSMYTDPCSSNASNPCHTVILVVHVLCTLIHVPPTLVMKFVFVGYSGSTWSMYTEPCSSYPCHEVILVVHVLCTLIHVPPTLVMKFVFVGYSGSKWSMYTEPCSSYPCHEVILVVHVLCTLIHVPPTLVMKFVFVGYSGSTWSMYTEPCSSYPCHEVCFCFSGSTCSMYTDPCSSYPCHSSAKCISNKEKYMCYCEHGNLLTYNGCKDIDENFDIFMNRYVKGMPAYLRNPFVSHTNDSMTIMFWIRILARPGENPVLLSLEKITIGTVIPTINTSIQQFIARSQSVILRNSSDTDYIHYGTDVADGKWHFMVFSLEPSGKIKIFIDSIKKTEYDRMSVALNVHEYQSWQVILGSADTLGRTSKLRIYKTVFNDIDIYKAKDNTSHLPSDQLIQGWTNIKLTRSTFKKVPSGAGDDNVCDINFPNCLDEDRTKPKISCPDDQIKIGTGRRLTAFTGLKNDYTKLEDVKHVNTSVHDDELYIYGSSNEVFIGYDEALNYGICRFKVYVKYDGCPMPETNANIVYCPNSKHICKLNCPYGEALSIKHKLKYRCGALGVYNFEHLRKQLILPTCGDQQNQTISLSVSLTYKTVTNCVPIFPSNIKTGLELKLKTDLPNLWPGMLWCGSQFECGKGTYRNDTTMTCEFCAIGSYQTNVGRTVCELCESSKTTLNFGSYSSTDCIDNCPPGQSYVPSASGCAPCEISYYQHMSGQDFCYPCPYGTITSEKGSNSSDRCYCKNAEKVPKLIEIQCKDTKTIALGWLRLGRVWFRLGRVWFKLGQALFRRV
ncbi:uncharacterized protein [Mytilus edulis]|uniref:uncharacterized protein n=1 Tax=Mytilus edulis TaxID=6550 RepID=UPI0039EFBD6E